LKKKIFKREKASLKIKKKKQRPGFPKVISHMKDRGIPGNLGEV
jgi:hypothetical protein